jgi:hypothetical protein
MSEFTLRMAAMIGILAIVPGEMWAGVHHSIAAIVLVLLAWIGGRIFTKACEDLKAGRYLEGSNLLG